MNAEKIAEEWLDTNGVIPLDSTDLKTELSKLIRDIRQQVAEKCAGAITHRALSAEMISVEPYICALNEAAELCHEVGKGGEG